MITSAKYLDRETRRDEVNAQNGIGFSEKMVGRDNGSIGMGSKEREEINC